MLILPKLGPQAISKQKVSTLKGKNRTTLLLCTRILLNFSYKMQNVRKKSTIRRFFNTSSSTIESTTQITLSSETQLVSNWYTIIFSTQNTIKASLKTCLSFQRLRQETKYRIKLAHLTKRDLISQKENIILKCWLKIAK